MNRIRDLRKKRSWMQEDLAKALNITRQAVGHYETEIRSLDVETIHKLCDIFGCSSDYLLGRSDLEFLELTEQELMLLQGFRGLGQQGRDYVLQSLALAVHAYSGENNIVSDLEAAT